MTARRRLVRRGAAAFAVLVAFGLALLLGLQSAPARRWALRAVQDALHGSGVVLEARDLEVSLLARHVRLTGVIVRAAAADAADLPPVLRADSIDLTVDPLPLLRNRLHIETASARGVELHLARERSGRTNLPVVAGGSSLEVDLGKLDATTLAVRLEDARTGLELRLPRVEVGAVGPDVRIEIRAPGGLERGGVALDLGSGTLDGHVDLARERLEIRSLTLATAAGTASLEGHVTLAAPGPTADLRLATEVDLGMLATLAGRPGDARGLVHATAAVNGPLARLEATIAMHGSGLDLCELHDLALDALGHIDSSRTELALDTASIRMTEGGRIEGSGRLGLASPGWPARLIADLDRVPLEPMAAVLGAPVAVASLASGRVTLETSDLGAGARAARGTASLLLVATQAEAKPGRVPANGVLELELEPERVTVALREMAALGATWNGRVALSGPIAPGRVPDLALDGRLDADVARVGRFERELRLLLALPGTPLGAEGRLAAGATLSGTLGQPRVDATVASAAMGLPGMPAVELAAELAIDAGGATLATATLASSGARIDVVSTIDSARRTLDAHACGDAVPLPSLLALLGRGDLAADGTIDLDAQVAGPWDALSGDARLRSAGVTWHARSLGPLEARVTADGAQVALEASLAELALFASGRAAVAAPHAAELRIEARGTDVERLPLVLEQRPRGSVTGTLRLAAPLASLVGEPADLEALELDLHLDPLSLAGADWTLGTDGPTALRLERGLLRLEPVGVLTGGSRVALGGSLALAPEAPPGVLAARGEAELSGLVSLGLPGAEASGHLIVDLAVLGASGETRLDGTVQLRDAQLTHPELRDPVREMNADVHLDGTSLRVERLEARVGAEGRIEADGELPLSLLAARFAPGASDALASGGEREARLRADLQGVSPRDLRACPWWVRGGMALHVEATAPQLEWSAVTAHARADELRLRSPSYELRAASPAELDLAGGALRLAPVVVEGPGTRLEVAGSLLAPEGRAPAVSLRASGTASLGALSLASRDVTGSGQSKLEIEVAGSLTDPELRGHVEVTHGKVAAVSPALELDELAAKVDLAGRRVNVTELKGTLNGGSLSMSGWIEPAGEGGRARADAKLESRRVYLDLPPGLETVSSSDLTLTSRDDGMLVLGGRVRILQGSYTETVKLQEWLRDHVRSGQQVDLTDDAERSAWPPTALDVSVRTQQPIEVDNNLARVALALRVRLAGTLEHPGLTGRAELEEGGEVFLNERRFLVERAIATFVSETRIAPELDVVAETSVGGYDVTLGIAGETGRFTTQLSSSPELAEPDILSLLLTGRTLEQVRGAEGDVAKEQALSYVSGRLSGFLERRGENGLGLARVRIEPSVIAGETDPRARLTIAKDLSRRLSLAFSTDLTGAGDTAYIVDYEVGRSLGARAIRQDDGTYRGEVAQRLRFGGVAEPPRRARESDAGRQGERGDGRGETGSRRRLQPVTDPNFVGPPAPETDAERAARRARNRDRRVGKIELEGNTIFDDKTVLDHFDLEPGDRAGFLTLRKGVKRVEHLYAKAGHLEARVRMTTERREQEIDVALAVVEGPKVEIVLDGEPLEHAADTAAEAWRGGAIDAQRSDTLRRSLREALVRAGYLEAKVTVAIEEPRDGRKLVRVHVARGSRFDALDLVVSGASPETTEALAKRFDDRAARAALLVAPWQKARELGSELKDQGYLDAKVERPRLEKDATTGRARLALKVSEGPAYRLGAVNIAGNATVPLASLETSLPARRGERYTPAVLDDTIRALQQHYWDLAYDRATVSTVLRRGASPGTVDLTLRIAEGLPRVVAGVRVEGNDRTSERMVESQLELEPTGGLLKDEHLTRSRRNLYETGAYSLVELRTEPMGPDEELDGPRALAPDGTATTRPVRVVARVREQRPFEVSYGTFYDSERGLGLSVDVLNRNSLGNARTVGVHARRDGELREARAFLGQPLLRRFPVKTTVTGYATRELREEEQVDRLGVSLTQEHRVGRRLVLSWGYRIEALRGLVVADALEQGIDAEPRTVRVAPAGIAFTRDTREDVLDPTRGTLLTQSIEAGASFLGSEVALVRYHVQHARYLGFGGTRADVFDKTRLLPRFLWASSLRVGLGHGLEDVPLAASTRFLAGGVSTVRGFAQDSLGPRLPDGRPAGGNALFLLNSELRFPLWWMFDGAAFVDAGNVYDKVSDFDPTDLRVGGGLGLRVRTPFVVLRLDYGRKLDRRAGESMGATYFSVGQMF